MFKAPEPMEKCKELTCGSNVDAIETRYGKWKWDDEDSILISALDIQMRSI